MKQDCLDIGTIQAFLDSELSKDEIGRVASHLGGCDDCALMLAAAEDESAIVFPALSREFDTLVPTQRLWTKINGEIETERSNRPFWSGAWTSMAAFFANPSIAVACGILLFIGIGSIFYLSRTTANVSVDPTIAKISTPTSPVALPAKVDSGVQDETVTPPTATVAGNVTRASVQRNDRIVAVKASAIKKVAVPVETPLSEDRSLGEDSYIRTIASLSKTVETQKETLLRPGERISYERDLAVVDDAISRMSKVVRKDPKNDSARQVLYSSYQSKIDLMNSVSQKEELVASLR